MRRRQLLLKCSTAALCAAPMLACGLAQPAGEAQERPAGAPAAAQRVVPGLEVLLRDSVHVVRGKRVGFLTNQTAVTSTGQSGIDLLHASPEMKLVALYGPEHGLRGGVEGGVKVAGGIDERTGVPVHSLYGTTQRPTADMLRGVDVLLFEDRKSVV